VAALRRELDGRPAIAIAGIVGVVGAIGVGIGIACDTDRALAAYLAAWCTVATIVLGGFVILLIGYGANARWPSAVRRMGEAISAGLVPIALLSIPLFVFADHVWPWVAPAVVPRAVAVKRAYLSLPFFTVRSALYFALAIVPAELLIRWSRRRDAAPEPPVPHGTDAMNRERALASAFLPVMGLSITFAGFDWLMSLDPEWWSSAFGLYVICGSLLSGMAMTIVLAWRGVASRAMPLGPGVFHAMGRLLHAFVILWAYIAYFQAMLIQIANKPNEAKFFVDRTVDGWRVVTALVFVLLFALPFPLLVPRRLKKRAGYLAAVAFLILLAHYLEMWWLVLPRIIDAPIPSWTDLAAICAVGGLTTAVCAWRMRGVPLLPVGDPYLRDGLAYETTT
jgi:hypothetical protein